MEDEEARRAGSTGWVTGTGSGQEGWDPEHMETRREGQVKARTAVRGKDMLGVEAAHDQGGPITRLGTCVTKGSMAADKVQTEDG